MFKHVESITGVVDVKRLVKVVCITGAAIMLAGCGSDATAEAATEAVDSAQSNVAPSEVDALDPPQSNVAPSEVDAVDSATVEGASAQVLYHDSYWVTKVEIPNSPDVTVINDMYVDLDTMRVTVYAQTQVLAGRIVAPPQVDPGECTDTLLGDRVCHHPDAVYLNGSGQELKTSDGTGEWWVRHSWILGGEGYDNCPLESAEVYENCFYVEGELLDDGVSMQIGGIEPGFEDFFNIRGPVLDSSPIEYEVRRHEPAEDGSGPVETFTLAWQCEEAASAFDGSDRTCRDS